MLSRYKVVNLEVWWENLSRMIWKRWGSWTWNCSSWAATCTSASSYESNMRRSVFRCAGATESSERIDQQRCWRRQASHYERTVDRISNPVNCFSVEKKLLCGHQYSKHWGTSARFWHIQSILCRNMTARGSLLQLAPQPLTHNAAWKLGNGNTTRLCPAISLAA